MSLSDRTVRDLLAALRSPEPTPGGGSASALAGALGAALLAMVAGIGRPRASTSDDLERLARAGRTTEQLSDDLTALADRDSEAYAAVLTAYKLPKSTDEERDIRSSHIQRALLDATIAPLNVMRKCAAALDQAPVIAELGNANASSDVEVGTELLRAGLRGARSNVEINLGSLKDGERVREIRGELARLTSVAS